MTESTLKPDSPFDEETWAQLPALLAHLPEPVHLVVWGDETNPREAEAMRLCQTLTDHFAAISSEVRPRQPNYDYWPVIGVMRGTAVSHEDCGVRLIGLPHGYAMTVFIAAIQAVSFRGMTAEALTRIQLSKLEQEVRAELITAPDNEAGVMMAHPLTNMAAASPHVRVFVVMADQFPVIVERYSVSYLPHTVLNGRVHIEGVVGEKEILEHMATAVTRDA
ncbi:MAG TPA: thioredoxin family protein [Chloroflexota bacterium]|nr:thioredoxin family protein [Chloroflexota bacterium]